MTYFDDINLKKLPRKSFDERRKLFRVEDR